MTTGGVGIAGHGGLANAVASGVLDPAESCASATSGGAGAGAARFRAKTRVGLASSAGRSFGRPHNENDHLTKTGSGQT